jgi:hypothetical protein
MVITLHLQGKACEEQEKAVDLLLREAMDLGMYRAFKNHLIFEVEGGGNNRLDLALDDQVEDAAARSFAAAKR